MAAPLQTLPSVEEKRSATPSPDESLGPVTPGTQGPPPLPPAFGPLAGPPTAAYNRYTRGHQRQSLSVGRGLDLTLALAPEDRERWAKSIQAANSHVGSDANRLPKSTGRQGIPAPPPKPEELVTLGRWEEDETYEYRKHTPLTNKQGRILRSIPCLMVSDIQSALPFYHEILGFVNVSKPDSTLANICRTTSGKRSLEAGEEGVQIYLRAPFVGAGQTPSSIPPPAPQSLWIEVENVDDMFAEIYTKAQRTHPTEDDYFPAFPFGKARIDGRPVNTPFGTREIKIYDADANLLVFFQDLKKQAQQKAGAAATATAAGARGAVVGADNLVRGPVFRPRNRQIRR